MWTPTTKADMVVRALADRHYTRQTPGAKMFTRPGYSFVLRCQCGHAGWVWWRPKWEDGRPGTSRKDGLRSLECTLFRREAGCSCGRASELVRAAVTALSTEAADAALHLSVVGGLAGLDATLPLLTAVGVEATAGRRGAGHLPGYCYRVAGWHEVADPRRPHLKGKMWLRGGL